MGAVGYNDDVWPGKVMSKFGLLDAVVPLCSTELPFSNISSIEC